MQLFQFRCDFLPSRSIFILHVFFRPFHCHLFHNPRGLLARFKTRLPIPWYEEKTYHYYLELKVGYLTFLENLFINFNSFLTTVFLPFFPPYFLSYVLIFFFHLALLFLAYFSFVVSRQISAASVDSEYIYISFLP